MRTLLSILVLVFVVSAHYLEIVQPSYLAGTRILNKDTVKITEGDTFTVVAVSTGGVDSVTTWWCDNKLFKTYNRRTWSADTVCFETSNVWTPWNERLLSDTKIDQGIYKLKMYTWDSVTAPIYDRDSFYIVVNDVDLPHTIDSIKIDGSPITSFVSFDKQTVSEFSFNLSYRSTNEPEAMFPNPIWPKLDTTFNSVISNQATVSNISDTLTVHYGTLFKLGGVYDTNYSKRNLFQTSIFNITYTSNGSSTTDTLLLITADSHYTDTNKVIIEILWHSTSISYNHVSKTVQMPEVRMFNLLGRSISVNKARGQYIKQANIPKLELNIR